MLEMLMSDWEELIKNEEYEPVHDALRAGVALLEKYYRRADDTDIYFISHSKPLLSRNAVFKTMSSLGPCCETSISRSRMGEKIHRDGNAALERTCE